MAGETTKNISVNKGYNGSTWFWNLEIVCCCGRFYQIEVFEESLPLFIKRVCDCGQEDEIEIYPDIAKVSGVTYEYNGCLLVFNLNR